MSNPAINQRRNAALGAHVAKEIDAIEAKWPKPVRSFAEAAGLLAQGQKKTIAALEACNGATDEDVDAFNKALHKLKREAALCSRLVKDLAAVVPAVSRDF